jgi:hypothetical protein
VNDFFGTGLLPQAGFEIPVQQSHFFEKTVRT